MHISFHTCRFGDLHMGKLSCNSADRGILFCNRGVKSVTKDNEFCKTIKRCGAILQIKHLFATAED